MAKFLFKKHKALKMTLVANTWNEALRCKVSLIVDAQLFPIIPVFVWNLSFLWGNDKILNNMYDLLTFGCEYAKKRFITT